MASGAWLRSPASQRPSLQPVTPQCPQRRTLLPRELDGRQGTRDDTSVVALEVRRLCSGERRPLGRLERIALHPVERDRCELVRARRVQVHFFAEAVAVQKKSSHPAGGERRQRRGVERQREFVAGAANPEETV